MDRDEQKDLKILAKAFFDNLEYDPNCEYGSIGVDCKRPFGNSDVEDDILEMVGCEPEDIECGDKVWSKAQRQYAESLYCEKLVPYLKPKFT
jgi:hypothetical protein